MDYCFCALEWHNFELWVYFQSIFHSVPHMASLPLVNQGLETGVQETFGIHSLNISVSYAHTHASSLTNTADESRCQNRLGASTGPFITLLWCSCLLY